MDRRDIEQGIPEDGFWFRGKKVLIRLMLTKYASGGGLKILVIGAGAGNDLDVISKFGQVYATDADEASVALIDSVLCYEKRVADACKLPYENDFFDLVLAFDVLEHIDDDKKAVGEVLRVTKKGGHLIYTVPAGPSLFGAHDRALGHYRRYTKKLTKRLLVNYNRHTNNHWNTLLYPLASLKRRSDKTKQDKIEGQNFPSFINKILAFILITEAYFVKLGIPLPFGLSIVGMARK